MTASDWAEVLCSLREVQGQEGAAAVSRWDRAVFLDLPAPVAIFTSVVNDCVYPEIYRFIGINRVVRYIWRKYIITVVIAKRNVA